MFEPQFTYTDKIVNYIAEIASAKEVISNAKIIPLYDTQLNRRLSLDLHIIQHQLRGIL